MDARCAHRSIVVGRWRHGNRRAGYAVLRHLQGGHGIRLTPLCSGRPPRSWPTGGGRRGAGNDARRTRCRVAGARRRSSRWRARTCHRPVMPGRTSSRVVCQSSYDSGANEVGRGPTRDMWPHTTLKICGSSSSDVRRRNRPTRVMRGSSGILKSGGGRMFRCASCDLSTSASATIVRSFHIWNGRPSRPVRRWLNKGAPGVSMRTARAHSATRTSTQGRARRHRSRSTARLAASLPPRETSRWGGRPLPSPGLHLQGGTGDRWLGDRHLAGDDRRLHGSQERADRQRVIRERRDGRPPRPGRPTRRVTASRASWRSVSGISTIRSCPTTQASSVRRKWLDVCGSAGHASDGALPSVPAAPLQLVEDGFDRLPTRHRRRCARSEARTMPGGRWRRSRAPPTRGAQGPSGGR